MIQINRVIDISHHQTVTSFAALVKANIAGVIHKATQGLSYVDPLYKQRVRPIRDAGLMHGAYHFGTGADGKAQADHFLAVVQPDERTLLALDLENNPDGPSMTLAQAEAFVTRIYEKTGRYPVLYSGNRVKELLGKRTKTVLAKCPLWLAEYGPTAVVPAAWEKWTLWQNTSDGSVPGIEGDVDRDLFAGDLTALRIFWGYPPNPA